MLSQGGQSINTLGARGTPQLSRRSEFEFVPEARRTSSSPIHHSHGSDGGGGRGPGADSGRKRPQVCGRWSPAAGRAGAPLHRRSAPTPDIPNDGRPSKVAAEFSRNLICEPKPPVSLFGSGFQFPPIASSSAGTLVVDTEDDHPRPFVEQRHEGGDVRSHPSPL